ncbi:MAG: hypothetical protein ACUZ8H_15575 [Candidatus Anammoxibacter sp.]
MKHCETCGHVDGSLKKGMCPDCVKRYRPKSIGRKDELLAELSFSTSLGGVKSVLSKLIKETV